MASREILLLGDERLYEIAREVTPGEFDKARQVVADLHDTIVSFRAKYGFGRAIAAPQIGEAVRVIYMKLPDETIAFVNPRLEFVDDEQFALWDDCMSFPGLEVWLNRYKKCRVHYQDLEGRECVREFVDDLAELFQHEYDHLDGILAVQRAIDAKAFRINKDKAGCY